MISLGFTTLIFLIHVYCAILLAKISPIQMQFDEDNKVHVIELYRAV